MNEWEQFMGRVRARNIMPNRRNVNSITQAEAVLTDTLSNREAIPRPTGESKMFRTDLTDYAVFFALSYALVAALFA